MQLYIIFAEASCTTLTRSRSGWVMHSPRKVPGPSSAEMQPRKRENLVAWNLTHDLWGAETRVEPSESMPKKIGRCCHSYPLGPLLWANWTGLTTSWWTLFSITSWFKLKINKQIISSAANSEVHMITLMVFNMNFIIQHLLYPLHVHRLTLYQMQPMARQCHKWSNIAKPKAKKIAREKKMVERSLSTQVFSYSEIWVK